MPTVERIREVYPDAPPPTLASRERARLALEARIGRPARRRLRLRLLPAAGLAAAAAAAAIALLGLGNEASIDARAASVLHKAAANARARRTSGEGSVLYVKSIDAYLNTWGEGGFSVLVPHVREIWQGPKRGLLDTSSGKLQFLSRQDRLRWIAAGRPRLTRPDGAPRTLPAASRSELPADPDALFDLLEARAKGHSVGTYPEMFTLAGDAFRETNLTPAQRAALFEVVAKIPGIALVGSVEDPLGRPGVAVAMKHGVDGIRQTLVIDPATGTLLSEEQVVLDGNPFGYPAGTVIGHSTYVVTANVGSVGTRPKEDRAAAGRSREATES